MKRIIYVAIAMVALLAVFWVMPGLDVEVSSFFYDPVKHFAAGDAPLWHFMYLSVKAVTGGSLLLMLAAGFWLLVLKKPLLGIDARKLAFLFAVLAIGPGLLVHTVMKDNFHRARPHQITEFGGDKHYSLPGVVSDQCDSNCSFPSGHAAGAFFVMAFAWVWPRRRQFFINAGVIYGLAEGLTRIVQGGHFLSDVTFSGLVVLAVIFVCDSLILEHS